MKSWVNYYYTSCVTTKKYFGGLSHALVNMVDDSLSRRSSCVSSPLNFLFSSNYLCYNSSVFKPDNVRSLNFNRSFFMDTKNSHYSNFRFSGSIDCDFADVYRHFFGSSLNNRLHLIGLRNNLNTLSTKKLLKPYGVIQPHRMKYVDNLSLIFRGIFKHHLLYPYITFSEVILPFRNKFFQTKFYNQIVDSRISISLLSHPGSPIRKIGRKRYFPPKLFADGYDGINTYSGAVRLFSFNKRYPMRSIINYRHPSELILSNSRHHFYYYDSAPTFVRKQSAHNFNFLFTLHYFYNYSKLIN